MVKLDARGLATSYGEVVPLPCALEAISEDWTKQCAVCRSPVVAGKRPRLARQIHYRALLHLAAQGATSEISGQQAAKDLPATTPYPGRIPPTLSVR